MRTVPAHDELHHDGESLVLLDGQVQRVSPIGTFIRQRAGGGATVEQLASELERTFGAPVGGDTMGFTKAAVEALLEAGLLIRDPS